MNSRLLNIPVDCDSCGFTGNVDAEIVADQAYWSCPSTLCERNQTDEKVTPWFDEEEER